MRLTRALCLLGAAALLLGLRTRPAAARPAQDASSMTITSSAAAPPHGQAITFIVTVTGAGACSPAAGENIVFSVDGTTVATVPLTASGVAAFTTSSLSSGSHSVAGQYNGDTNCAPANASLQQIVSNLGATLTTLIATASMPASGTAVLLTATVSGAGTPCVLPSGSVTFTETTGGNYQVLGSAPIGTIYPDQALFAELGFAPGMHMVQASYPGDANCAPSMSGTATVTAFGNGTPLLGTNGQPNTTPATALGINILTSVGSSGTQALLPGCTAVTLTSFAGTPVSAIAALVAPQGVVTGIWRFDAVAQRYLAGFLAAFGAPLDFSTTSGKPETYSVCLASGGAIHSG